MAARNYLPGDFFRENGETNAKGESQAGNRPVKEKVKLAAKMSLLSAILFVVLSGRAKDSPLTTPLR